MGAMIQCSRCFGHRKAVRALSALLLFQVIAGYRDDCHSKMYGHQGRESVTRKARGYMAFVPSKLQLKTTTLATTTSRTAVPSSWNEVEKALGASFKTEQPISVDSVLTPAKPPFYDNPDCPILFRERHGWCPYSERVFLALEMANVEYYTIRIDNTGGPRPSYYAGQTPQMKWPDTSRVQGESLDLVEEVDARYCDGSLRSKDSDVKHVISQFRSIFPRARPSSRAAFLFQNNGDPLWKSTFETTLEGTDELLGKTSSEGPFFLGSEVTAADIAWAPFLERYRYQLPCLHQGLDPADGGKYPHLAKWYKAMEDSIPAYACRVKGDASSWRKVLSMAGFGNSFVPPNVQGNMDERVSIEEQRAVEIVSDSSYQDLWNQYVSTRPHLAPTPYAEVASILCRNHKAIIGDTLKRAPTWKERGLPQSEADIDSTLRALAWVLLTKGGLGSSEESSSNPRDVVGGEMVDGVAAFASFLDERMCVPRDMGEICAATIKALPVELK